MADLKNVPGPAWYIAAVTLSIALIVLCIAFVITFQTARTEECRHRFLGLELGPDRDCGPNSSEDRVFTAEQAAALTSFLDRRWCDASSSRKEDEEYHNEAPYPIDVAIATRHAFGDRRNFCRLAVTIDGRRLVEQVDNHPDWHKKCSVTVTVPPGSSYRVTADSDVPDKVGKNGDGDIETWHELVGRDRAPRGCFAE